MEIDIKKVLDALDKRKREMHIHYEELKASMAKATQKKWGPRLFDRLLNKKGPESGPTPLAPDSTPGKGNRGL